MWFCRNGQLLSIIEMCGLTDSTLKSLTAKTGAPKKGVKAPQFNWTPDMQQAFEQVKTQMAADVL
jgi:hypothetical protein